MINLKDQIWDQVRNQSWNCVQKQLSSGIQIQVQDQILKQIPVLFWFHLWDQVLDQSDD